MQIFSRRLFLRLGTFSRALDILQSRQALFDEALWSKISCLKIQNSSNSSHAFVPEGHRFEMFQIRIELGTNHSDFNKMQQKIDRSIQKALAFPPANKLLSKL